MRAHRLSFPPLSLRPGAPCTSTSSRVGPTPTTCLNVGDSSSVDSCPWTLDLVLGPVGLEQLVGEPLGQLEHVVTRPGIGEVQQRRARMPDLHTGKSVQLSSYVIVGLA